MPIYTFSLDALLSAKAKDAEREQTLQRTEALLASTEDDVPATIPQQLSDKGIVDAAVGNETGGKVMDMLNRREAWKLEYTWYFFGRGGQPKPRNAFPTDSLQGWSSRMRGKNLLSEARLAANTVERACCTSPDVPIWMCSRHVYHTP